MELLSAIHSRLNAGIRVVLAKKTDQPDDPVAIPRPSWVQAVDDTVVLTPAQAFATFKRG